MNAESKKMINKHLIDFFQSANLADATPSNLLIARAATEIYKSKKKYIAQREIQISISNFIKDAILQKDSSFTATINNSSFINTFNANELNQLTNQIINYFISLPRKYICIFKLPNVISPHQFNVQINKNISLEFIKPEHTGGLFDKVAEKNVQYSLIIKIKFSGYLSFGNYDEPYADFKHLIGIATAFDYFESTPFSSAGGLFGTSWIRLASDSYFFDEELGKESKINIHFPDKIAEKLYDLEFNRKIVKNNHEIKINHIKDIYLSLENDEPHARRIRSTLEWNYDSIFTSNTTFTFILNCIAIEALMGDSGTTIGKILGNRCAYMLAKTNKDRKYLIDKIQELYTLRSNLVHGNQSRPSKEDSETIFFAAVLLKQLIQHELLLLFHSNK